MFSFSNDMNVWMINPIGFSLANFPSSWYLSIEDTTVLEQISQERKKKQHKFSKTIITILKVCELSSTNQQNWLVIYQQL